MLILVLEGVPLDVGVVFAVVVAVCSVVTKRDTDLVPGVTPAGPGAPGAAETSAPSARRLRMLTR
jgi:hypothetical protein